MIEAGRSANAGGIPVIFDPVGQGATDFRNRMAAEIMSHVSMSVVRGNMSEILSLGGEHIHTKGVDTGGTVEIRELRPSHPAWLKNGRLWLLSAALLIL